MSDTRRTKMSHGMWQVTGTGELRHAVLGTVEKVYGGWYAVSQDGETYPCQKLGDGQAWLLEQYKRYAARIVTLQPSDIVDHITEDGTELTRKPYPFHVDINGLVQRQDFWRGDPYRVVGFVVDPSSHDVHLRWDEIFDRPERAVGMYVVTADAEETWSTHVVAIASAGVL